MTFLEQKTDAALLKEFSAGKNTAAFEALVKRHGPMVHAVSMRVLSNHHDAQEVTQAVFLALAKEAGKLANRPSVAGWLHTVSRRLSLNARKSRESRQRREEAAMNESETATPDATMGADFRHELDAALARLPDRYREPLVYFHLEGAPLKEVAERLELHPTTLRTRLSRAREMLRTILNRRGVEVASIATLSALFASEAKAAAFTPTLCSTVLETATAEGAAVSPHILELAAQAAGASTFSIASTLTTLTILMKTKASLITAAAIALLAIGTTTYIVNANGNSDRDAQDSNAAVSEPSTSKEGSSKITALQPVDLVSRLSDGEQLEALLEPVLLMADDTERLAAIRGRLGMDISDEVYRLAVADYGFQVDAENLFWALLKRWVEDDPRAIMSWTGRIQGEFGDRMVQKVFSAWLVEDEAAALAWAEGNLETSDLEIAQQAAERMKSQPAPRSSAEEIKLLRDMQEKLLTLSGTRIESQNARGKLMSEMGHNLTIWALRDPEAALEYALSLDQSTMKDIGLTRSLFRSRAERDPDAALELAKSLTDAEERALALVAVLPSWQLKYPGRTIDEAVDLSLIPDRRYQSLLYKLVKDRATADPSGAVDFVMKLEDPGQQKKAVGVVVESWMRREPADARAWVTALPAGELRDAGLSEVGDRLAETDFASASRLVREIEDPQLKERTVSAMVAYSGALENDLPQALQLAGDEIPRFEFMELIRWTSHITPDGVAPFRAWLEEINSSRRIQFNTYSNPEGVDPERVRKYNETEAANGYRYILEALEKASQAE